MSTAPSSSSPPAAALLRTPLHAVHQELGARMVPFAGYEMPVQYPGPGQGLLAEHLHTRHAASLFDVSHMGQLLLRGARAAAALESLMPVDVIDLAPGRQRYGLLTSDGGGILDDLMFCKREDEIFMVVNGACKAADIAHLQTRIGACCEIAPLPDQALLALQGPRAADALARLLDGVQRLVFMTGARFVWQGLELFITRSGYSGEDGFEVSLPGAGAEAFARALLAQPEVRPAGLGARNSLRLEAGLCLHGHDIDAGTTPLEAALGWALQKVRRPGGARAGGYPGALKIEAQLRDPGAIARRRVGLLALERVPVRDGAALQTRDGAPAGQVSSGLLSPSLDQAIAMGYVPAALAAAGTPLQAIVRGRPVPMQVCALPFVPHRYHRG